MTTQTNRRDAATYAPAPSTQPLITEGLDCIINGRPYPAHLQPVAIAAPCPATTEQGIAAILAGPAAQA